MEIFIISILAFIISILTFFSGFGLGTLLTPIFIIIFPVDLAIGLTGIVHLLNNVFKFLLVGKLADRYVLLRFGLPAVFAAMLGSFLLINISSVNPIYVYNLYGKQFEVYLIKLIISTILILLFIIDFIPYFKNLQFNKNKLPIGGLLSGFFGGLSGNQGALRTAFLIKIGLSKDVFIATAVVISLFVDLTRLGIYSSNFYKDSFKDNLTLIICATLSAIIGSFIGNKLLKKITLKFLHVSVGLMLLIISILIGAGII